jgi:hypothetical protein
MLDPKELQERTVRAVKGAGYDWLLLTPAEQARHVEIANELLRAPLRELKALADALERGRQRSQNLTIQLGEASVLSSEVMAYLANPVPIQGTWDRMAAMMPSVRRWLAATQRFLAPVPR